MCGPNKEISFANLPVFERYEQLIATIPISIEKQKMTTNLNIHILCYNFFVKPTYDHKITAGAACKTF